MTPESRLSLLTVRSIANWPSFITFAIFTLAGNWGNGLVEVAPLWLRTALPLLAATISWVPILVVNRLARSAHAVWRGLTVTLGVIVLVGVLRGVVLDYLLVGFGVVAEQRLTYRVVSGILSSVAVLVGMAFIVGAARVHAMKVAELRTRTEELSQARDAIGDEISDRNVELVEQVKNLLTAEVQQLDDDRPEVSLAILRRTASELVRPLSHELASQVPQWAPQSRRESGKVTVNLRAVLTGKSTPRPFMPRLTALTLGLFSAPQALSVATTPTRYLAPVLIGLVTWAVLVLLNTATSRVAQSHSWLRVVTAVGGLIGCGLVEVVVLWVTLPSLVGPLGTRLALTTLFFMPALAAGLGVLGSVQGERLSVEDSLKSTAKELTWQVARVGQVQWCQQRALSRALHGPVQSAVTAAAIRMDAALREGSDLAGLVREMQDDLSRVIARISSDDDADTGVLAITLHRLEATWKEIAEITMNVDPDVAEDISQDRVAEMCVAELVGEAMSNAIRHGHARHVWITLAVSGTTVTLVMEDDGRLVASRESGIGSRLLAEMSISAQVEEMDDGHTRLTAIVPLERQLVSI